MIVALLLIALGLLLLFFGIRRLRHIRSGQWLRDPRTEILISQPPGGEEPQALLRHDTLILQGPSIARWRTDTAVATALDNPDLQPDRPGASVPSGDYQVLQVVDLGHPDPFGLGGRALDSTIQRLFGRSAMILTPRDGAGPPVLLHGHAGQGGGTTIGSLAVPQAFLDGVIALMGDPRGLSVTIRRSNIRRRGWGTRRPARSGRMARNGRS